jgi:hypothetical protein
MSEYNQALNEVAKYLSPSVGFSDHDSPKEDSKIIIRQNNTILQLLIQVLEKLNSVQSNKDIVLSSSGIVPSSRNINSEKWMYLTASPEETNSSR